MSIDLDPICRFIPPEIKGDTDAFQQWFERRYTYVPTRVFLELDGIFFPEQLTEQKDGDGKIAPIDINDTILTEWLEQRKSELALPPQTLQYLQEVFATIKNLDDFNAWRAAHGKRQEETPEAVYAQMEPNVLDVNGTFSHAKAEVLLRSCRLFDDMDESVDGPTARKQFRAISDQPPNLVSYVENIYRGNITGFFEGRPLKGELTLVVHVKSKAIDRIEHVASESAMNIDGADVYLASRLTELLQGHELPLTKDGTYPQRLSFRLEPQQEPKVALKPQGPEPKPDPEREKRAQAIDAELERLTKLAEAAAGNPKPKPPSWRVPSDPFADLESLLDMPPRPTGADLDTLIGAPTGQLSAVARARRTSSTLGPASHWNNFARPIVDSFWHVESNAGYERPAGLVDVQIGIVIENGRVKKVVGLQPERRDTYPDELVISAKEVVDGSVLLSRYDFADRLVARLNEAVKRRRPHVGGEDGTYKKWYKFKVNEAVGLIGARK